MRQMLFTAKCENYDYETHKHGWVEQVAANMGTYVGGVIWTYEKKCVGVVYLEIKLWRLGGGGLTIPV